MQNNISWQHEEEMPKTPGEFLCLFLCEQHGLSAKQAVEVWIELQEYCHRYVQMKTNEKCYLNGIAFDGHGGMFVCLKKELE
jgi:hypothetical protein